MDKDSNLFGNTTFSTVLEDIYNNSTAKRKKIDNLLDQLKNLVNNVNDAVLVVPLIKEYLEVGVKNDEQLIKMAGIAQKLLAEDGGAGIEGLLTSEEKKQLLEDIKDETEEIKKIEEDSENVITKLETKTEKLKEKVNNGRIKRK